MAPTVRLPSSTTEPTALAEPSRKLAILARPSGKPGAGPDQFPTFAHAPPPPGGGTQSHTSSSDSDTAHKTVHALGAEIVPSALMVQSTAPVLPSSGSFTSSVFLAPSMP